MNLTFYLVRIGKLYKIGFTKSPVREKVSALQRSYSEKVQLVSSFQTKNGKKNEDYFNERLAVYRVSGDWFNLPQQLIDCNKDWFNSCLVEAISSTTTSGKGFKSKLKPKEFTKRYFAVLEAAKDRSPQ